MKALLTALVMSTVVAIPTAFAESPADLTDVELGTRGLHCRRY